MVVRIYEVQPHYKIIYFDIDITILCISHYFVVNILSFIVSFLTSGLIGYYYRLLIVFYFIRIFISEVQIRFLQFSYTSFVLLKM